MVYRTDRFGRGGDQVEMLAAGFPAIRVTEAAEHYDRQHQDLRTENGRVYGDTIDGVDFPYLARVTRLNVSLDSLDDEVFRAMIHETFTTSNDAKAASFRGCSCSWYSTVPCLCFSIRSA